MAPDCMSFIFLPNVAIPTKRLLLGQTSKHRTRMDVLVWTSPCRRPAASLPTSLKRPPVRLLVERDQVLAAIPLRRRSKHSCTISWAKRGNSLTSRLPPTHFHPRRNKYTGPASILTALALIASRHPATMTQPRRPSTPALPETAPIISTRGSWRRKRAMLTFSSARAQRRLQTMVFCVRNTEHAATSHHSGTNSQRRLRQSTEPNSPRRARSRAILSRMSGRKRLDLTSSSPRSRGNQRLRPRGPSGRSRSLGRFG